MRYLLLSMVFLVGSLSADPRLDQQYYTCHAPYSAVNADAEYKDGCPKVGIIQHGDGTASGSIEYSREGLSRYLSHGSNDVYLKGSGSLMGEPYVELDSDCNIVTADNGAATTYATRDWHLSIRWSEYDTGTEKGTLTFEVNCFDGVAQ